MKQSYPRVTATHDELVSIDELYVDHSVRIKFFYVRVPAYHITLVQEVLRGLVDSAEPVVEPYNQDSAVGRVAESGYIVFRLIPVHRPVVFHLIVSPHVVYPDVFIERPHCESVRFLWVGLDAGYYVWCL